MPPNLAYKKLGINKFDKMNQLIVFKCTYCCFVCPALFSNVVTLNDLWHHLVFAQDRTWT